VDSKVHPTVLVLQDATGVFNKYKKAFTDPLAAVMNSLAALLEDTNESIG
jgi:hypothetical protein